jgi:hypothetical protein
MYSMMSGETESTISRRHEKQNAKEMLNLAIIPTH